MSTRKPLESALLNI